MYVYSHLPSSLVVWPVGVVVTFTFCGKVRSVCGMVCREECYVCLWARAHIQRHIHPIHTYAWYEAINNNNNSETVKESQRKRRWSPMTAFSARLLNNNLLLLFFFLLFSLLPHLSSSSFYSSIRRLCSLQTRLGYFVNFVWLLCAWECVRVLLLAFFDFNFI